ncbi:MAG: asparagine--tRNA ligase [Patescibacteria group bacterium]
MIKTRIKELGSYIGQEVSLSGWVYNLRSSGSIIFLQFRDGYGFIQAIAAKNSVDEEIWENAKKITIESSVVLTGKVTEHPKQKGVYELQVNNIELINIAEEYPIGKKDHGPEFLLDNRHLWLRSPKQWAIQRIRYTIIRETYDYFSQEGFIKIDAPILTPTACEGTTTLFEINYFDKDKAYLTQSGQLYIEAAIMSHNRVFDFGPVFRAEKSKTRRHLTEFWMMDAEMSFVDHRDNMTIQENLITSIVKRVLKDNQEELKILERDIKLLEKIATPFDKITYTEAVDILQKQGSEMKWGDDFGADDEAIISRQHEKPVFVEKYPAIIKPFYMKRDPLNDKVAMNNDLLAPEGYGEIIGGSQREDDYEILIKRFKEYNVPIEPYEWYLDLRRYGSVPHAGFGYGLERLTAWICGIHHIRETIPFPRLMNRLTP